ncbi:MAG: hypothetical protein FJY91_01530 [Candidatus Harrisonbacteria bacterium]|nr:hypothetical protein [Candidatus Harrisonbacteria bacterium]
MKKQTQKKRLLRGGFIVLFFLFLGLIFYGVLSEKESFLEASGPGNLTPGSGSGKLQLVTSVNTSSVEIFPGNDTNRNVRVIVKSGSDSVRLENDGNSVFVGTETSLPFSLIANDQTRLTILSSGNVGVGTSTPLRKLDILGGLKFSQDFYIGASKKTFPFTRSVAGVISLAVPTTSLALGNILSATTGTKLDAAYSTTSASDFTVGTANTGFSGTFERIWGENTDANVVVNTAGECTKTVNGETFRISRSKMTAHWENAGRACPKNWWVCSAADWPSSAGSCTTATYSYANLTTALNSTTFVFFKSTNSEIASFVWNLIFSTPYYLARTFFKDRTESSIDYSSTLSVFCCRY